MPKPTSQEITLIEEYHPNILRANSLSVSNETEKLDATELLSLLNKASDRIEAEKAKVMRPLLDATAAERARWKPAETQLEAAVAAIRRKLTEYQTRARAAALAQAEAIASRVGDGKGHLQAETAAAKISAITSPSGLVETDSGSLTFRTTKAFEIVDLSKVPLEYHLADEVAIRKAMKAGKELPGVRYFTEEVPYNSR